MIAVDSIPVDMFSYEVEPDNTGTIIYDNGRELLRIPNIDRDGNEILASAGLAATTEEAIRSSYKQYIVTILCPHLDDFYERFMKRDPFVDSVVGAPWDFRFKTTNIFKSLLDMAALVSGTTVDVRDAESVLHTLSLADATTIMLGLAVALKDRYREYSDVRAMLINNNDGTGMAEYRALLAKYNPPPVFN